MIRQTIITSFFLIMLNSFNQTRDFMVDNFKNPTKINVESFFESDSLGQFPNLMNMDVNANSMFTVTETSVNAHLSNIASSHSDTDGTQVFSLLEFIDFLIDNDFLYKTNDNDKVLIFNETKNVYEEKSGTPPSFNDIQRDPIHFMQANQNANGYAIQINYAPSAILRGLEQNKITWDEALKSGQLTLNNRVMI